jgi:release factor glutamine methyltransferase
VSRIVGTKGFWKHDFKVTPAVLCPRADSETLIELAVKAPVPEQAKVLDLCTGSGCLAISLAGEKPQWHIDATDSCPHALEVAQENMATCGVQDRVCLHLGDLWAHCTGPYQLIVSNPPYIGETERAELDPEVLDYDPALALFSGTDGLDLMRRLVGEAAQHLAPEGILMVEHGHQQSEAVQALFTQAGFTGVDSHRDLGGRLRVTQGTRRS